MRILVVGATGVLGRAMLPHLAGHEVVGTTRSAARVVELERLGATAVVCDVFAPDALRRAARAARPDAVVNLLTDLSAGPGPANDRVRREGGPLVRGAAVDAGARRLVVESVAFPLPGVSGEAVASLERDALASGLEVLVLRFGRLWGPGTGHPDAPPAPSVRLEPAGRRAAELVLGGPPGVHHIT